MNFHLTNNIPAIFLAPMEGVTDTAMRDFLTSRLPFTHAVTEFLRITHQVPPSKTFLKHFPECNSHSKTRSGTPVVFQLLGGDPDHLCSAALKAVSLGAKAIDLNFGCPAPTVNRHDGGATLLKYPDRIYTIIHTLRSELPKEVPISAKIRLGFDEPNDVYKNSDMAFLAGVDWLTIHARTRNQGYRPPAFWEYIRDIKSNAPVPIIANGDIWTIEDFRRCRDLTKCDHFMLGRGVLADPWLVGDIARELGIQNKVALTTWGNLFSEFIETNLHHGHTTEVTLRRIKQWLSFRKVKFETPCFQVIKYYDQLKDFKQYLSENPLLDMSHNQEQDLPI